MYITVLTQLARVLDHTSKHEIRDVAELERGGLFRESLPVEDVRGSSLVFV